MFFVKPSRLPRIGDKKIVAEQALLAVLDRPGHVSRFTHETIYPGDTVTIVGMDIESAGEWIEVRELRVASNSGATATISENILK